MTELANLSLEELVELQKRAASELEARQTAERAKAQQDILSIAAKYGIEVKFGTGSSASKPAKGKRAVVAVKYRHPENSSLTWTGRGRSPVWIAEWKEKHGSLDGVLVS